MTVENPQMLQEMFPGQFVEYAAEIRFSSPSSLASSSSSASPLPSPLLPPLRPPLPVGSENERLGGKATTLTPVFTPGKRLGHESVLGGLSGWPLL